MNDLAAFSCFIVSEETGKMAAAITLETIGHCQGDKQAIMRRGFLWKKQRGGEKKTGELFPLFGFSLLLDTEAEAEDLFDHLKIFYPLCSISIGRRRNVFLCTALRILG